MTPPRGPAGSKPHRDALTVDRIVHAATSVIERSGIEKLTMRTLADELGVTQMATYYHVKSKEEVLDLVVDSVLARVAVPDAAAGSWDERLRTLCHAQVRALRSYRGLGAHVAKARLGEHQLRIYTGLIDILHESGLSGDDVMRAFAMVQTYLIGRSIVTERVRGEGRQRLEQALGPAASHDRGEELVDFALGQMVDGLKRRIG